jgi:predicted GIY-YIG superfamily endonuclease
MRQLLLFPDPRPLVERFGSDFFRQAPECAGVYLMRDAADTVLYVGKAKNLRKRLGSYRVANPDRLRKRHLKLLRVVSRIELQECPDEESALMRESELLRTLRPRFNRAGTWAGPSRFLTWRQAALGLELTISVGVEPGEAFYGPLGARAIPLRATLARLLWCSIHRERGYVRMAQGWFAGRHGETVIIPRFGVQSIELEEAAKWLSAACVGDVGGFIAWIRERTSGQTTPFELATRELDLEGILRLMVPAGGINSHVQSHALRPSP